jgi:glycosyltransferase involved in cell wall biosynthesis
MKIVLCWQGISGYLAACWKALAATPGVQLSILSAPSFRNFDVSLIAGLDAHVMTEEQNCDPGFIKKWVQQRNPDVIVISGWTQPIWNQLPFLPEFASKPFVLAFDTPYRGTLRQQLAPLKLRTLRRRMNAALVPGERAWQYARRLGFNENQIRRGMYGIDFTSLSPLYEQRLAENNNQWPKKFLFIGRYAADKAIDMLVPAYRIYCQRTQNPWPLTTCGAGALTDLLTNVPNLTNRGFVQPKDQPGIWSSHGAFVLASRFDPWPLVVVEACAAGLPIVCTESCGSSVELVRSLYNGVIVGTENPEALARGLSWIHEHYDQCAAMGERSRQLAAAYSAQMWAQRITQLSHDLAP